MKLVRFGFNRYNIYLEDEYSRELHNSDYVFPYAVPIWTALRVLFKGGDR